MSRHSNILFVALFWNVLPFCVFVFSFSSLHAQDSLPRFVLKVNGYVKHLPYFSFDKNLELKQANQLVHQRLNFRLSMPKGFSAAAEFRTRWFWGDEVRMTPGFSSRLRNDNEQIDAAYTWHNDRNHTVFTNTERLWLQYKKDRWTARIGRQRINWGMANTWNPNDIFNAFNFLDFDYEERPGSDAVLVKYMSSPSSELDLALSPNIHENKQVGAVRYFTNINSYDLQFIAGKYHRDYTIGAGWAGSIKQAGFKGELQYFLSPDAKEHQFNASLEGDYLFSEAWYVNTGFLWNSTGLTTAPDNWLNLNFRLSPRNPMPTAFNVLAGVSKEVTPLFSVSFNTVYAPGTRLLIALPSLHYDLGDHWDANLVCQLFYAELSGRFEAVVYQGFLRLKYSF